MQANNQYPDLMGFRNSIRVVDQKVFAIAEPDMDYLSQKECEYLDKWFVYCKEKDSKTELSPESHDKGEKELIATELS